MPFFQTLKDLKNFKWTEECQQAFEDLTKFLNSPPLLSMPNQGKILYLYLSATNNIIASVLVREEENDQMPIYYISKVLRGTE